MLQISICDDDSYYLDYAYKLVQSFVQNLDTETQIHYFHTGEELLSFVLDEKHPMDILILDIVMDTISGFDVAERIHSEYPDTLLIFCSNYDDCVYESFRFNAFRFIRKLYASDELPAALTAAVSILRQKSNDCILLKDEEESWIVKKSEILYFQTCHRKCAVVLSDGKVFYLRKTIRELSQELNGKNFIKIHSGGVVNIQYVHYFSDQTVVLRNGTRMPVSRSHKKELQHAIIERLRSVLEDGKN